jgi:signal transduction histidine kinase
MEKQNEELHRLNDLKNTFLGMAAHDLRGPIAHIKLGMDVLKQPSGWVSREEREKFIDVFLNTLDKQTEYMLNLLNELLDVSQIESGKLNLRYETVDFPAFLTEVIDLQSQAAHSKGTQLIVEDIPAGNVVIDPQRLRQAIDNLISNAVKYSPRNSQVTIRVEHTLDWWKVMVCDQGPGITETDRRYMFQDFSRLSAIPTGGEKSIGLGLAISRRVIEAHGGKIGVDSNPGKGSIFWFTIPD